MPEIAVMIKNLHGEMSVKRLMELVVSTTLLAKKWFVVNVPVKKLLSPSNRKSQSRHATKKQCASLWCAHSFAVNPDIFCRRSGCGARPAGGFFLDRFASLFL